MSDRDAGGAQPSISNTVVNSTADHLIQVGVLHGDLNLTLRAPEPEDPQAAAERRLALSLLGQWRAEADAWRMARPAPLPVRWTPSARVPSTGQSLWADTGSSLADTFLGLPHRRLVVLGSGGSGKTVLAVLLTLDLLARKLGIASRQGHGTEPRNPAQPDTPVPLLLSLESWDTRRLSLAAWLEERLRLDHPGLPFVDGEHPAGLLVRRRRVLPVLDGLDELPAPRRAEVLDALAEGLGTDGDAVLVSRTDAYEALSASGHALENATVIESLPLRPRDVARYLDQVARHTGRADAWAPLVRALTDEPSGPLAQALSSPLMVWLVRQTYAAAPADPRELVDGRFPDRRSVETHLLDRIVPAAFPRLPPDDGRLHPPRPWDPQRARVWLAFLARQLSRRGESELAWWRLSQAPLPRLLALPALIAAGIVVSLLIDLVSAGYAADSLLGEMSVRSTVLGGVVYATVARWAAEHYFGHRLAQPRRTANPLLFIAALRAAERHSRVGPLARLAVLNGVPAVAVLLLALYAFGGHDAVLVLLAVGMLLPAVMMVVVAAPADALDAATPTELLRGERSALLATVTLVAPLIGLGTAAFYELSGGDGLWPGFIAWLGASAALFLVSPSSRWLLAKATLATTGRVPWSLMTFLEDARTAGLLQRSGGTYRFRNRRLQDHLAGRSPSAVDEGRPPQPAPAAARAQTSGGRGRPQSADGTDRRSGETVLSTRQEPSVFRGMHVERTADRFLVRGRSRRVPMAHWPVIASLTVMTAVRFSVTGQWREATGWVSLLFFPVLGILLCLLGLAMPSRRWELELTRQAVRGRFGRLHAHYAWTDVTQIAVRRVSLHGLQTPTYSLQVRLRDGAPVPGRRLRLGGGWYHVLALGLTDDVDPQLAAALADFAQERWRPAGTG
ncbi:NACHT domain-containing protein [Streptomyces thermoviolaceus]|uniref:NACHT domain-containing protein n=1 Tax=Streptomyces thermoviolaceus TaxID=1952 RepID=UPI00386AAC42|nr:NACHT domain-containing protein [Streptomyces thermoviolaceus]